MVKAIEFAVRDSAGGVVRGAVAGDAGGNFVQMATGEEISLNLSRESITAYTRTGDDLIITLVDGREIVLDGYFNAAGEPNQLYLSQNGEIVAVELTGAGDGSLQVAYGGVEGWDKFSTLDDLRFGQGDDLALAYGTTDEPAGMAAFVPGLLGGGGLGLLGAGVGTAVLIGGGGGGGGGGGDGGGGGGGVRPPTVNDPNSTQTVTTNSTDKTLDVSGTGQPGDTVKVTIGTVVVTTTIGTNGTWAVTVPEANLPADGSYVTSVLFTHAGGTTTTLPGPTFILDLTPPDVDVTAGAKSTGDIENASEYTDGVTISGTGEPGAAIVVAVGTSTQTTTVAPNGTWSVTFPTTVIAPGEHEVPFTVTATDTLGNRTVINDVAVIDTVANPINFNSVTSDNLVNGSEAAAGFSITGTSVAGATLTVTIQGVTQTVTAGANGQWSVTFPAGQLTPGEYDATITATSTDAAGNASSQTHTFRVDTTTSVAFAGTAIAGDNVVNATEAAAGVTMTGTAQPGATVQVAWNGTTLPATVDASGNWTVSFPASAIPAGTYSSTATVTATDAAGNTATATRTIQVDTNPNPIAFDPVTSGNVVNGAEAGAGFQITGTSVAGATLSVTIQGITQSVTVGADGRWSVNFPAGQLTPGEYDATVIATTTDAAGNPSSQTHTFRVDTSTSVAFAPGAVEGDNTVNAFEAMDGVVLTGTTQPGNTVQVQWNGQTLPATVDASGAWTVTFPASAVAAGTYSSTATVTATDAAGNSATATRTILVDTETNVSFNATQAGDNIISGGERSSGFAITGRSEAGARVEVTVEGVTRTVTADASGNWTASFPAGSVPAGTYQTMMSVRATDANGNVALAEQAIRIDTEVVPMEVDPARTGTDGILNAAEAAQGLTVTGFVEAGSTVMVRLGNGTTVPATVAFDGSWTVTIPAGQIPTGENTVPLTITATDAVGNTSTVTQNVQIDTTVRNFQLSAAPIAGDGVVNATEAAAGVTLSGTVEPGSTVVVRLSNGSQLTTTAGANGLWSVTFNEAQLPDGTGTATATLTATDPVGNVKVLTQTFGYDTDTPDGLDTLKIVRDGQEVTGIYTDPNGESVALYQIGANGTVSELGHVVNENTTTFIDGRRVTVDGYEFDRGVPDGSYLVIGNTDAAGNEAATLLIVNNTNTVTVDLNRAGLGEFDFSAIDLNFAPEASLTITAAQLEALTGPDKELIVKGGSDDLVRLDDAVNTLQTRVIEGQTYHVYTLGSGTVLVDEDIRTSIV